MRDERRMEGLRFFIPPPSLLEARFGRGANPELLSMFEAYIFAARRQHATRADCATDCSADGRAFTASKDRSDNCADTCAGSDLRDIILRPALRLDTAFIINICAAVTIACVNNFDHLRFEISPPTVLADLVERQLQFRAPFYFSGTLDACHMSFDHRVLEFRGLENAGLKTVTALCGVRRKIRQKLDAHNCV